MMKPAMRASAFLLLAMVAARSAEAHRPYERAAGVAFDASGRRFELVKYYTDGILFTDPSSLQIRDAEGRVVAETPGSRDTIVRSALGQQYVYAYDTPLSVLPTHAWAIRDARLVEISTGGYVLGIVAPLWEHWFGYLVAAVLCLLPWVVFRRALACRGWFRNVAIGLGMLLGVVWWPMWLWMVAGDTELCVVTTGAVVASMVWMDAVFQRALRRSRLTTG